MTTTSIPSVRIVTDSTADIPPEIARQMGITVVPANVQFGAETFRDGVDLSCDDFYRRLVEGPVLPTTATPAVGVFAATYRQLFQAAEAAGQPLEGIVSVHLAAQLSGLFNCARLGAEDLPEAAIRVIDGRQVSMGTGWLAILAARAAQEGKNLAQVVAFVEERIPKVRLITMLDTLEYVRRSGRLGRAQWLVGTLLNIKPILEVRDGVVLPSLDRVRTRSRAMDRLVEIAEGAGPFEELAVVHAHAPETGQALLARVGHLHPPERIFFGEIGVTIGTYAGPGAVGMIWVNK